MSRWMWFDGAPCGASLSTVKIQTITKSRLQIAARNHPEVHT
jgi:hypothetical protein